MRFMDLMVRCGSVEATDKIIISGTAAPYRAADFVFLRRVAWITTLASLLKRESGALVSKIVGSPDVWLPATWFVLPGVQIFAPSSPAHRRAGAQSTVRQGLSRCG